MSNSPSSSLEIQAVMDEIVSKIAHKQRIRAQRTCNRHYSPPPSTHEPTDVTRPETPEPGVVAPVSTRAIAMPLKSILKVPKVRFFPDDRPDDNEQHIRLPPPPPPPGMEIQRAYPPLIHPLPLPAPPAPPPPPLQPQTEKISPPAPPPGERPRPPSIFDRQIETDQYLSKPAFELYTKFFDELDQFVDQQGEVIRRRLAVQERRAELRRLRDRVIRCDMDFMNHLRQYITEEKTWDKRELNRLFEASELARDEVGPLEAEYEPLEVSLGAAEYKLEERYGMLEARFEQFFHLSANPSSLQSTPSKIQYETSTAASSNSAGENELNNLFSDAALLHGALIGDQVAIGQAPMRAKGSLARPVLRHEHETRHEKRHTISSDPADQSKTHPSSTGEERTPGDLPPELFGMLGADESDMVHSSDNEVRHQRMWQTLTGIAFQSIFDTPDELVPFPDEIIADSKLDECKVLHLSASLEDAEESFNDNAAVIEELLHDYLASFTNTHDRINLWILHQLRLSRREAYELQRHVVDGAPEVEDWAIIALQQWSSDQCDDSQAYILGSESASSVSAAHHIVTPQTNKTLNRAQEVQESQPPSFVSNEAVAPLTDDQ